MTRLYPLEVEEISKNYDVSEPKIGDEIILAGATSDRLNGQVDHLYHFLVRNGEILHEPYLSDSNWQPVTIEDLRQGIARRAYEASTNPRQQQPSP